MKKIMFNDKYGLTQAVLDGRKTMTRRVCKYDKPNETYDIVFPVFEPNDYDNDGNIVSPLNYAFSWKNDKGDFTGWNIPKYKVGEVVAIAQCYKSLGMNPELALDDKDGIGFYTKTKFAPGWENKMFVRADLMPHHIRITDIKVERLQNISDEDCMREGVEFSQEQYKYDGAKSYFVQNITEIGSRWNRMFCKHFGTPRGAFAALIDKVSGKGTWESNPYVFVYEFELVD
ncbi:hypothetical protein [Bacteroides clarus]|uniref:hypothetical protein n=1 Tax=Bacteroides clarus TaxID=626929 RepID=UPI0018982AEB|nr:hypothetical protein [Bacteroides clarus]